jgi:hypothetical protein
MVYTGFIDGLAKFLRKFPDARAHFHNVCPDVLVKEFGIRVQYTPEQVDFMDYPAMCKTFQWDVCCVPLYDCSFNHAKSDLRLLDMAPFYIPCLASPVSDFKKHAGVLCGLVPDGQWDLHLELALTNRKNLTNMAETARHWAFARRTSELISRKWDDVLYQALTLDPSNPLGTPSLGKDSSHQPEGESAIHFQSCAKELPDTQTAGERSCCKAEQSPPLIPTEPISRSS